MNQLKTLDERLQAARLEIRVFNKIREIVKIDFGEEAEEFKNNLDKAQQDINVIAWAMMCSVQE